MHGKQTVNCKEHFLHKQKGMFYKQTMGKMKDKETPEVLQNAISSNTHTV